MKQSLKLSKIVRRRLSLLVLFFLFAACDHTKEAGKSRRIEIGYQTAWATSGQLIETLVHTNIPKLYGSSATFRTFLFGPDMNEAALSGNIDGTNTGVVPTINLLAASDDWVVVCRLIDFPVSIVARAGTGVEKVEDLKGRKLGVPFGGGSHPYVVQRLIEHGLKIGSGADAVELVNLTPSEHITAMQQGAVDAVGTWEPQTSKLTGKGLGKTIDEDRHPGFLTVRKTLVEQHPQEVSALIKAYVEGNYYVATHRDQSDAWFAARSGFTTEEIRRIKVIEPNVSATAINEVKIQITDEDITRTQQIADQMHSSGLIKRHIVVIGRVNQKLSAQAFAEMTHDGSKAGQIKIAQP